MICPDCGHDNIDGADSCEECLGDLRHEDIPRATTKMERHIMEKAVGAIVVEQPPRLPPDTALAEAIVAMRGAGAGCVLVVGEDEKLLGILTERDVLHKVAGKEDSVDVNSVRLGDFATRDPETIESNASLQYALHRMELNNFRHLPIDQDGKAGGLVTSRDILNFIENNFREAITGSFHRSDLGC